MEAKETKPEDFVSFNREINPSKLLSGEETVKEMEKELMLMQMARTGLMNIADTTVERRSIEICRVACLINEVNRKLVGLISKIRQCEI